MPSKLLLINLNKKSSLARKFVETLDQKQSICLLKEEAFETEETNKKILEGYLEKEIKKENGKIALSVEEVSQIRWDVISYLNLLEAVLMAWRHNIADKEMIFEEFKYLVKPSEGHDVLKEFRKAAGDTFPAIDEFVKKLEEKSLLSTGKGKIA